MLIFPISHHGPPASKFWGNVRKISFHLGISKIAKLPISQKEDDTAADENHHVRFGTFDTVISAVATGFFLEDVTGTCAHTTGILRR